MQVAMSSRLTVVLLALMLGIQPVSSDLYLPALPLLTQEFGASMAQVHLTLSALLLAFGISQLFWGPLSDLWGRRPVLLLGLTAYVVAGVGCVVAPSIDALIVWRILQGTAMGSVVVCARAIVRDLYTPEIGARVMSKALTGLGAIACLSAPIGALLTQIYSWHAALGAVAFFGAICLIAIAWKYQETAPDVSISASSFTELVSAWTRILQHPTFVAFACLSMGSYGGLFTFLATSAFVFIGVVGLSKFEYGLLMCSMSFIYMLGTFLCRWLLVRFGVARAVAIGGGLSLTGGLLLNVSAWMQWNSVLALVGPFYIFILGHGIHQPCGQSGAVGPFPQAAGTASALGGFLMMAVAFGMGLWLGQQSHGAVHGMAWGIGMWSVVTSLTAWTLVQRISLTHD
jgi:DHA1 family bicyclomycin/chloramphenicol resistance-like MFS transporter